MTYREPTAKRIANRWLVNEVGNLLMADKGALIRSDAGWVWQFEVFRVRKSITSRIPLGDGLATTGTYSFTDP
jgi:hypothetical protein